MDHNYFTYILASPNRSVIYVGVTNDLVRRVFEHNNNPKGFAGKWNCVDLVYYEHFTDINQAIQREKQIKKWSRKKKDDLIKRMNPKLDDLIPNFY